MKWRGPLFGLICAGWLLFTPLAAFMALMSPFLSDGGTSPAVWMLMINFFTLPVATVLAPVAGAVAYRKHHRRTGWILLAVPLLWLVIPFVVWGLLPATRLS